MPVADLDLEQFLEAQMEIGTGGRVVGARGTQEPQHER